MSKIMTEDEASRAYYSYNMGFMFMDIEDLIDIKYLSYDEWLKENDIKIERN